MYILFCGELEELCKLASIVNRPSIFLPINLLCKGPMGSASISPIAGLDEEQIAKILDKLCEEGLVEHVEKGRLKVYIPKYIIKLEEFEEFDELAHKIGDELSERLDSLIIDNDKVIIKAFEDKGGEYSLGALIAQLTLKSLTYFLEGVRKKLRCEAEDIAEILSKKRY
ncbi:MAG: hypothetical protein H3Z50_08005 [archaeon]|nr:hypothetical protein [archaeon]MCP8306408.1 hypothetical protein [archaeon]